jgi:predicted acyltransferase
MEKEALPQPAPKPVGASVPARLGSLDAYRGLVMFLMMAEVLRLSRVASAAGGPFWKFLAYHQSHVEWIGCSLHDLIQPSFSFLVGAALPFSLANRTARGQSSVRTTVHAAWRALILILLGVFLRSLHADQTYWTFEDTLSQIGMGYFFLYLIGRRPVREQWIALGVLLVGYWAAFSLYPLPGPEFEYTTVGVAANWPHLMTGFPAHWNKNANLAWAFDTWFLNLFPRTKPFVFNGGGYATLSFIPTLATMLLGVLAGGVIRGSRPQLAKVQWLVLGGAISLLGGALLGAAGICPVVKRIWTPAWVLYSGGWCFILLGAFYYIMDVRGWKAWVFPLVVVGMNSIAAYCIAHLFEGFVEKNLSIHLGQNAFRILWEAYEPLVRGAMTLAVFWLLLCWMYRRKIFLRI